MSEQTPLQEALSSPEKTLQKGDRKVEFRSTDELLKMEQHLNRQKRTKKPLYSNVHYQVDRGL
ncbi:hypothetical protein [Algicola sagamiensis]|uniref:hypothetical protein n=1 Tax=Algicola sagamiensis TaxID=163869 RepID=UPI00036D2949|nr:hypothetical protein [Algicola sagamiensis]